MKAIILNSGIGKRMGALTYKKPKCLVKINSGETILSRQIKILLENEIEEIIITTGPFEEQIINEISNEFGDINVKFINNELFFKTNYIYSMSLIEDLKCNQVLVMHGDLVFDEEVIKRITDKKDLSLAVINSSEKLSDKDFKAKIVNDRIVKIDISIFDGNCYNLYPIYKLGIKDYEMWITQIQKFIKNNMLNVYAENALNICLEDKICLKPFYIENELCKEVDDIEDLEKIKLKLNKREIL